MFTGFRMYGGSSPMLGYGMQRHESVVVNVVVESRDGKRCSGVGLEKMRRKAD